MMRARAAFVALAIKQCGRQKMGADRYVWIEFVNPLQKASGARPLDPAPHTILTRRLIRRVIQPTEKSGRSGNHLEVAVAIHLAKCRRHQCQHIEIRDRDVSASLPQRQFHTFGRPHVAGPDRCRKD